MPVRGARHSRHHEGPMGQASASRIETAQQDARAAPRAAPLSNVLQLHVGTQPQPLPRGIDRNRPQQHGDQPLPAGAQPNRGTRIGHESDDAGRARPMTEPVLHTQVGEGRRGDRLVAPVPVQKDEGEQGQGNDGGHLGPCRRAGGAAGAAPTLVAGCHGDGQTSGLFHPNCTPTTALRGFRPGARGLRGRPPHRVSGGHPRDPR